MTVLSQFVGGVKSIQYGTLGVSGGSTTGTATISAVNTAKTMLVHLGQSGTATDLASFFSSLTLTNSTTVTATRSASTQLTAISFVAVEFF